MGHGINVLENLFVISEVLVRHDPVVVVSKQKKSNEINTCMFKSVFMPRNKYWRYVHVFVKCLDVL